MSLPPVPPVFPETEEFARAFFSEAVRHLSDARMLHSRGRYAASITSSMKAAEVGVKAVLILENAMGLYDKIFNTHKPLTIIEGHILLKRLNPALEMQRAGLSADVKEMESLEPTAFGKGDYDPTKGEANTEYPFLEKQTDPFGNFFTRLVSPQEHFTEVASLKDYRLARELLAALPQMYPVILVWKLRLPRPL